GHLKTPPYERVDASKDDAELVRARGHVGQYIITRRQHPSISVDGPIGADDTQTRLERALTGARSCCLLPVYVPDQPKVSMAPQRQGTGKPTYQPPIPSKYLGFLYGDLGLSQAEIARLLGKTLAAVERGVKAAQLKPREPVLGEYNRAALRRFS